MSEEMDHSTRANGLTRTEVLILTEFVCRASAAEVGLRLLMSDTVIKQRLRSILRRIGSRTRSEAAAWLERTQRRSA
ncbi:MAG TPA: LuxR family transcriptional regulator [bacterium]|nr:LuxR family transcriptional regulator [bacterium]